jgi:hypothetical protein
MDERRQRHQDSVANGAKRSTAIASVTLVTVAVCLVYAAAVLVVVEWDPMRFVLLGSRYAQGVPNGQQGYDGQFSYQIARNPLQGWRYVDRPAYRYQRILYPLLARLFALGHRDWIPYTLILANIVAIGLCGFFAAQILDYYDVNAWYALPCGLYVGLLIALRLDTNEPWCHALILASIWFHVKGKTWLTAFAVSLAMFAKETAIVAFSAFSISFLLSQEWKRIWQLLLAAALPFVGYRLLLYDWFGSIGLASGGSGATTFSLVPFGGLLRIGGDSIALSPIWPMIVTPLVALPSLAAIILAGHSLQQGLWNPLVLMLLGYGLLMIVLPSSTYRELSGTARLSIGLAHSMVLYGGLRRNRRVLDGGLLWVFSLVLLIWFIQM